MHDNRYSIVSIEHRHKFNVAVVQCRSSMFDGGPRNGKRKKGIYCIEEADKQVKLLGHVIQNLVLCIESSTSLYILQ